MLTRFYFNLLQLYENTKEKEEKRLKEEKSFFKKDAMGWYVSRIQYFLTKVFYVPKLPTYQYLPLFISFIESETIDTMIGFAMCRWDLGSWKLMVNGWTYRVYDYGVKLWSNIRINGMLIVNKLGGRTSTAAAAEKGILNEIFIHSILADVFHLQLFNFSLSIVIMIIIIFTPWIYALKKLQAE